MLNPWPRGQGRTPVPALVAGPSGHPLRLRDTSPRASLYFMKYVHFQAFARLPPTLPQGGRVVVRARLRRDGRHRGDPRSDRPRDRRGPCSPSPPADALGDRDRGRRTGPARPERLPAADRRPGVAGHRARSAQPALRAAAATRARLLRRPADGPADVAGHSRPAGRPLLPRLRTHLHRPVDPDHRFGGDRDVRAATRAGGDLAGPGAVRGADRRRATESTRSRRSGRLSSGSPS